MADIAMVSWALLKAVSWRYLDVLATGCRSAPRAASDIARTELRRQAGWADARFELLKTSVWRQIGENDGVIEQPLRLHVDNWPRASAGCSVLCQCLG